MFLSHHPGIRLFLGCEWFQAQTLLEDEMPRK
jgi:hypothetical protein